MDVNSLVYTKDERLVDHLRTLRRQAGHPTAPWAVVDSIYNTCLANVLRRLEMSASDGESDVQVKVPARALGYAWLRPRLVHLLTEDGRRVACEAAGHAATMLQDLFSRQGLNASVKVEPGSDGAGGEDAFCLVLDLSWEV